MNKAAACYLTRRQKLDLIDRSRYCQIVLKSCKTLDQLDIAWSWVFNLLCRTTLPFNLCLRTYEFKRKELRE
jgi:hypothetical protein